MQYMSIFDCIVGAIAVVALVACWMYSRSEYATNRHIIEQHRAAPNKVGSTGNSTK